MPSKINPQQMNKIYHVGYEKQEIDVFIKHLKKSKIQTLIDVRELPLSRKKGFSKNSLKNFLHNNDIDYVHIRQLGTPKKMRKDLKESGDYLDFFKKYRIYIKDKHTEIKKLVKMLKYKTLCIMCFEKDSQLCHRSIVLDEVQKEIPKIKHIPMMIG